MVWTCSRICFEAFVRFLLFDRDSGANNKQCIAHFISLRSNRVVALVAAAAVVVVVVVVVEGLLSRTYTVPATSFLCRLRQSRHHEGCSR